MHGTLRGTAAAAWGVGAAVRGTASMLAAALVETLSGALVGGLVVYVSQPERAVNVRAVVLGCVVGALIGVVVLLSRLGQTHDPAGAFPDGPEACAQE